MGRRATKPKPTVMEWWVELRPVVLQVIKTAGLVAVAYRAPELLRLLAH